MVPAHRDIDERGDERDNNFTRQALKRGKLHLLFEITIKSPRRCNSERNPWHSAVSDREYSHATHGKTDRNYLGSAKFFVQDINA